MQIRIHSHEMAQLTYMQSSALRLTYHDIYDDAVREWYDQPCQRFVLHECFQV